MRTTETPLALTRLISASTASTSATASAEVGSSMISTLRLEGGGAGDRDRLPLPAGKLLDLGRQARDADLQRVQHLRAPRRASVALSRKRAARHLAAEEEVARDVDRVAEAEVLEDHLDAARRGHRPARRSAPARRRSRSCRRRGCRCRRGSWSASTCRRRCRRRGPGIRRDRGRDRRRAAPRASRRSCGCRAARRAVSPGGRGEAGRRRRRRAGARQVRKRHLKTAAIGLDVLLGDDASPARAMVFSTVPPSCRASSAPRRPARPCRPGPAGSTPAT